MKRRLCLILAVLLVGTFASAQARTQLSIICNVAGAQVFIAGQVVGTTNPNLTINLRPGIYVVRVTMQGFNDFETRVSLGARGASISIVLQPNFQGAQDLAPGDANQPHGVVEGGSPMGDTNAPLPAPASVPARVDTTLQGLSYQVSVNANVNGALVFVNGQQVWQTPNVALLMPGSYTLLVRAPGFLDYQVPLNVSGPQSLYVSLQSATSPWQLRVPEGMYNREAEPGRGMRIWIDGALQAVADGQASGQLTIGRHVVRIAAGDLVSETPIDVQIGKAYVFEPFLGISVK